MLEIRQELSKTSTKKYDAMEIAMGEGDRVRGLLQFYGANRTGRLLCYIALLLAEYAGSSRGTCENEGSRRRSQYSGSNDTASI